eukprot:TRINITY_DN2063_c0_g1_i1.p1 TRINITY_DN2063_c0_g1~~TRINITY_DN2063_c0_g1_i1.p1  ORF type:complete len:139 (-),score=49.46 TRINITY_DN2063_c0_g1_i1:71-487(-)
MGSRSSDMDTFFILDLMKQKREERRRQEKDDLINEMASKMREDREKPRTGVISYGGFLGVNNLTRDAPTTPRSLRRKQRRAPEESSPEEKHHPLDRTDLLIMGMIRDEKEKKQHELHQVYDEMAAVPSEERWMEKYEH